MCSIVPAVAVGAHFGGLEGAAAAVLFVNAAFGISLLTGMMRLLHVPVREFADAILRPAAGWALLAASLLVLRPLVDELPSGLALIALVGVGATVYAVVVALFARNIVVTMWLGLRGARVSG